MTPAPSVVALLPAAGDSTRFGAAGRSKVLVPLAGVSLIERSARTLIAEPAVAFCVIAVRASDLDEVSALFAADQRVVVVVGGAVRQESVARALAAARSRGALSPDTLVLVHDAARCLVSPELVRRVIDAGREHGAAVAALPVVDTLKRVDGTVVTSSVDRDRVWAMQTPQVFRLALLEKAHAMGKGAGATDDVSLVQAMSPVQVVLGDRCNLKITTQEDLAFAELLVRAQESPRS